MYLIDNEFKNPAILLFSNVKSKSCDKIFLLCADNDKLIFKKKSEEAFSIVESIKDVKDSFIYYL